VRLRSARAPGVAHGGGSAEVDIVPGTLLLTPLHCGEKIEAFAYMSKDNYNEACRAQQLEERGRAPLSQEDQYRAGSQQEGRTPTAPQTGSCNTLECKDCRRTQTAKVRRHREDRRRYPSSNRCSPNPVHCALSPITVVPRESPPSATVGLMQSREPAARAPHSRSRRGACPHMDRNTHAASFSIKC
jgi:hypothetical protein